jgi:hypothetical protein
MIVLPYDYFLIGWFVLAVASTAYVAVDQFRNNPEPTVMKWGFILVTLYMGPFGLLLDVLRRPVRSAGSFSRRRTGPNCTPIAALCRAEPI